MSCSFLVVLTAFSSSFTCILLAVSLNISSGTHLLVHVFSSCVLFCSGEAFSARVLCERCEPGIEVCVRASDWACHSRRSFGGGWWCRRSHHEQDSWVSMEICCFVAFRSLQLESLFCFQLGFLLLLQVEASLRYSTARSHSVCSCDCWKHPSFGANTRRQSHSPWSSKQCWP